MPRGNLHQRPWGRGVIMAMLVLLALTQGRVRAQGGALSYTLTELNPDSFPQVSFHLRAVDAGGHAPGALNATSLGLFENGRAVPAQNIALTPLAKNKTPMAIVFVLDMGANNNFEAQAAALRAAMQQLLNGNVFIDGVDTVKILARISDNGDRTEALLRETKSSKILADWIRQQEFRKRSPRPTKGLEAVADGLNQDMLSMLMPVPGAGPAAIILFSRGIEDPPESVAVNAARNIGQSARGHGIIIHTVRTEPGAATGQIPLKTLAESANGRTVALSGSTVGNDMDALYRALDASRAAYQVTYTSTLGSSGLRHITVGAPDQPISGKNAFTLTLKEPVVVIQDPPTNSQLRRTLGPDKLSYLPLRQTVKANVTFVDGFTRTLESSQVLVDGRADVSARPPFSGNKFEFDVDLSNLINQPNSQRVLQLGVRVKDSLGFESTGRTEVNLIAPAFPPTPTPPAPPQPPASSVPWALIAIALALMTVGGIGLGYYYYYYTHRKKPLPSDGKTLIVSGALGTLTVLEGPPKLENEQIKIIQNVTIIGRNPQVAHITFYADKESSVSRVHATISRKSDGRFMLMDNGSSSGTRLNGRQLPPKQPVELQDADEIVLGDLGRRGIKLRFGLGSAGDVFGGSDKTRIDKYTNSPH